MASADWGPWGEASQSPSKVFKPKIDTCISAILPSGWFNYAKAATTTIVIGHLLARLAEKVQPVDKTFCIGHSLGGHICGFAGKDYR